MHGFTDLGCPEVWRTVGLALRLAGMHALLFVFAVEDVWPYTKTKWILKRLLADLANLRVCACAAERSASPAPAAAVFSDSKMLATSMGK